MVHATGIHSVRESLLAQARAAGTDPVALEALRADIRAFVSLVRLSMDRAFDFAARGLVSEAAAVVGDFPDLARQAQALCMLPSSDAAVERLWREQIDVGAQPLALPSAEEIDRLALLVTQAERLRALLDGLRLAALRGEALPARLDLLRRLREADPRNRVWLDQIEALEKDWLGRMGDLAQRGGERSEFEQALAALAGREWVASVPSGLRDALRARVAPLRERDAEERYAAIAAEVHRAAGLMDRGALERLEAEWAGVYHGTGCMPAAELESAVAPAFAWLSTAAQEDSAQRDFEARVDELDRALDQRRPWAEVDRMLAALRDSGRSAPEGTVGRALRWISAERERERRRHRLVLAGGLAAATVVIVTGVVAVRAWSRTTEARDAAARLVERIESGDAPGARALAEELRGRGDLDTPEVAAALAREESLQGEWAAERAEVARRSGALSSELAAAGASRARLGEIATELASLAPRARLAEESAELARLGSLHGQRLAELDAADRKAADAVLDDHRMVVERWGTPDRWSDREQLDAQRWRAYLDALGESRAGLERTLADVAGLASQESRLSLAIDGCRELEDEARTRTAALQASLRALAPAAVGAPVSSERVFVDRVQALLADHGAVLQRQGMLDAFERSRDCAPAWLSMQAWRDEVRPRLEAVLGPSLAGIPAAEQRDQMLALVRDFLGRFPDSPYRARADALARRLDPGARQRIWDAKELGDNLGDTRFAGLQEVPLRAGGLFYRRPSAIDTDPLHRVVDSLADVTEDPDSLGAIMLARDAIEGGVRACEVSDAWAEAERRIASAPPEELPSIMLALLQRLKSGSAGDSLFRLRALRDGADILLRSGHAPAAVERPLREWIDWVRQNADQAVSADWPRAALDGGSDTVVLRRRAFEAVQRFPSVEAVARQAEAEQRRMGLELASFAPIGILLPAGADGGRAYEGANFEGPVAVVVRDGAAWRLAEGRLSAGTLGIEDAGIPKGPVLVFRRSGT